MKRWIVFLFMVCLLSPIPLFWVDNLILVGMIFAVCASAGWALGSLLAIHWLTNHHFE